MSDERLERYAELVVGAGANVRRGQLVDIFGRPEHAPLARALARAAYRAGARYVDVFYSDQHVRRALIEHGPDESLQFSPPWLVSRARELADEHGAAIAITGEPEPDLLADLDGDRVGRVRMKELNAEVMRQTNERLVNWTVVAYPNDGWARAVFDKPDVERLWEALSFAVRLDEPDPVVAWREHADRLERRARALDALNLDAVRFRGAGTDLTVGLLERSRWVGPWSETVTGIRYIANMPTEEVFTTPDARRTDGTVRATRPLPLLGTTVRGLELDFEQGDVVAVRAETGAELVRAQVATDEGSKRLGEVALVDGASRVGQLGITFFDGLFDENATCHLALGSAYAEAVEGEATPEELNDSTTHSDFMVGGPEVDVDGVTKEGRVLPLLRDDVWQLDE